jgi:hypothetical protein
LIDGISVFSLAHLSELDPSIAMIDNYHTMDATEDRSEATPDTRSDGGCSMEYDSLQETVDVGFRLSMAGFSTAGLTQPSHVSDDLMDDLTPTSFTNVLESLRRRITSIMPNSEDMVSRAIVKALSEDKCETLSSCSSLGSSCSIDSYCMSPVQIEADAVWETTEWINLNVQYAPRPDVLEQKRDFLQRQMDTVFMHVHYDRLSEDAAARILSNVATLLGVPLRMAVPRDTLILRDLDKTTDRESLLSSLMVYGEIQHVGMASGQRFGKFQEILHHCNFIVVNVNQ